MGGVSNRDWKNGLVVKRVYVLLLEQTQFSFWHPYWAAYNHLLTPSQAIENMCIYIPICLNTHIINKNLENNEVARYSEYTFNPTT